MNPIIAKHLILYPYFFLNSRLPFKLVRQFEETQWLVGQDSYDRQWKQLKEMLSYAYDNIPYYRKAFASHNVCPSDIRSKDDLLKLPVLSRDDVKSNAEKLRNPSILGRTYTRQTSGSSGSPLHLSKDRECITAMDAVMFRNYGWYGIQMGQKEGRFWGSPLTAKGAAKVKLKDGLMNRVRFSPFDISDSACQAFIRKLRRFVPDYIYGYAQTIVRFSEFVVRHDIDLSDLPIRVVIVTGEMINDGQIALVEQAFKCLVSNEYGCTEVGIIGMTCPDKRMHVMSDNLLVEFVKDGRHAQPGEAGEIVVTELYGKLMPLIRYRVGDIGYFDDGLCTCGRGLPLLGGIVGRNDEFIICPDGRQIDPIIFEYILTEIPPRYGKVRQFRITQEPGWILNVEIVYEGALIDDMVAVVQRKLQTAVGAEFRIAFRSTESLQAEASGKLRCFVSKVRN